MREFGFNGGKRGRLRIPSVLFHWVNYLLQAVSQSPLDSWLEGGESRPITPRYRLRPTAP